MKRFTIFIIILVIMLGNVAYAGRVEMEYPSNLPPVDDIVGSNDNYFIVKDSRGYIRLFKVEPSMRIEYDEDGWEYLYLYRQHPNRLYHYELKSGDWDYNMYDKSTMNIYGFEILYTNYELIDRATGEVFFPIVPPTLEEITAESVEEIPGTMVGTMKKIFPAGFGILLAIVLVRSLKVLYQYF